MTIKQQQIQIPKFGASQHIWLKKILKSKESLSNNLPWLYMRQSEEGFRQGPKKLGID
jgi:hypothetical protein